MRQEAFTHRFFPALLMLAYATALSSWNLFDMTMLLMGFGLFLSPAKNWMNLKSYQNHSLKFFNYAVSVWLLIVALGYLVHFPLSADQWTDLLSFRWIIGFYLILCAAQYTEPQKHLDLKIAIITLALLAAGLINQFYFITDGDPTHRFTGFFGNTNHYALTLSLIWSYLLGWITSDVLDGKKISKTLVIAFVALGVCLLGTFGRSAWMGCAGAVALLFFLFRRNRLVTFATLFSVLLVGALFALNVWSLRDRIMYSFEFKPDDSSGLRLILWKTNWQIFMDHPIIGVGFYENIQLLPQYYEKLGFTDTKFFAHAHNQYIQALAGTGILGLLSYLLIFFTGIKYFFSRFRNGLNATQRKVALSALLMLVAFLFESLTESPFNLREPRNLLMLFGACSYVWCTKLEKKDTTP